MKKSKIFMVTGAFALAVAAVFATKANKKFTSVITAKVNGIGLYLKLPSGVLTEASSRPSGSKTAFIKLLSNGSQIALKTLLTKNGGKPVYYY